MVVRTFKKIVFKIQKYPFGTPSANSQFIRIVTLVSSDNCEFKCSCLFVEPFTNKSAMGTAGRAQTRYALRQS